MATSRTTKVLGVKGTKLTLDGKPFFWQGVAFFNALYNPNFNKSDEDRMQWLRKFKANGISVLRIWCQWSIPKPRNHVDLGPESTLFAFDGAVREQPFQRLATLLKQMDSLDMVLEHTLHGHPACYGVMEGERLVGLLSHEDITSALATYGHTVRVRDVMQRDYPSVSPRDTIARAWRLMATSGRHALPVVEDRKLLGMVTAQQIGEIYSFLAARQRQERGLR